MPDFSDRQNQDQLMADNIRQRLDTFWPEEAPHMVTSWIVVATTINGTGEKILVSMNSEDMANWESLGMLEHSLAKEKAKITAHAVIEHQNGSGC